MTIYVAEVVSKDYMPIKFMKCVIVQWQLCHPLMQTKKNNINRSPDHWNRPLLSRCKENNMNE